MEAALADGDGNDVVLGAALAVRAEVGGADGEIAWCRGELDPAFFVRIALECPSLLCNSGVGRREVSRVGHRRERALAQARVETFGHGRERNHGTPHNRLSTSVTSESHPAQVANREETHPEHQHAGGEDSGACAGDSAAD